MNKLILFCGPSGSGKTTIVHHLLDKNPALSFSISATTRKRRENEIHGKDYYFLTIEDFKKKIKNNEFLEWEEVYENGFYGTLRSEIERINSINKLAIFDVDVKGGLSIKKLYGKDVLAVFVRPPSLEELIKRLKLRSTETASGFQKRIKRAELELNYANHFDKIIINNDLSCTLQEAQKLIDEILLSKNLS